ncbi:hypothetical protein D3C87_1699150 [compost metagenome]
MGVIDTARPMPDHIYNPGKISCQVDASQHAFDAIGHFPHCVANLQALLQLVGSAVFDAKPRGALVFFDGFRREQA